MRPDITGPCSVASPLLSDGAANDSLPLTTGVTFLSSTREFSSISLANQLGEIFVFSVASECLLSFSFLDSESSIWILHPLWRKTCGAAFLYDVWCQRELNLTRHNYPFWPQLLAKHSGIRWPKLSQDANIASEDGKPYFAFKNCPETEKNCLFTQLWKSMCYVTCPKTVSFQM